MKFKKMEIYGFKSFADKLEVSFDSGVTAIVGPNGCGKSNVADGIRFVMGESSAKSMRGSSMQDVIFNGTQTRKPLSYCEVGLHFDNTERIFPLEYDQVVLSRKLYKSGESEYAINKNPVRRKDIIDALRDSGLGRDSYCVIGQGKIDSLLSVKPEDRRTIFEEAAGISRFKSRKQEAENKLERTRDNLTRLNDIIFELENQIAPLTKQSENARKFLDYKERLKNLELNVYVYQYDHANGAKAEIRNRIEGIDQELALKQSELDKAVETFNASMTNINKLDDEIKVLNGDLLDLTVELEKQNGEAKLIQERINSLTEQNQKVDTQINQDDILRKTIRETIANKTLELEDKKRLLTELEKQIERVNNEYLDIVDRLTAGEQSTKESGEEIYNALESLGDIKSTVSSLQAEKAVLSEKQEELDQKLSLLRDNLTENSAKLDGKHKDVSALASKLSDKKVQQATFLENVNLINEQLNALSLELDDKKVEYHTKLSRARVLQEMAEDNEGFIVSVKRLLDQAKTNSTLGGMMVGVVAKLMKVPANLEVAIEMALGASVQNIVTKNEEDAKYIVNFLKERKFGRATFLPISSMKERRIADIVEDNLSHRGVLGVASELIKFDPKLAPVFKSLLGSTVIVDNMDNAIAFSKVTRYSAKIVTLDGDVINPQGSISGGSRKESTSNIIGREREISDLNKELKLLAEEISADTKKVEQFKQKQQDINEKLLSLNGDIHNIELEFIRTRDEADVLDDQIAEIEHQIRQTEYSKDALQDRMIALNDALEIASAKVGEKLAQKTEASENKRKADTKFDMLRKQRESLYDNLTELKIQQTAANSTIVSIVSEIDKLNSDLAVSEYRYRENKLSYQKNATQIAEYTTMLEGVTLDANYQASVAQINQIKTKLAGLDDYKREQQFAMNQADACKMDLSIEIQRISEKRAKEEMRITQIDTEVETMQERVWEEYNMTYADALAYKLETFELKEGLAESAKLKRQIQALGYVNVNAIEELNNVTTRYNDLAGQRDDLSSAEADLLKIIKELTNQMEDKFKTQFEQINNNFQKVFRELFGGGRAELQLQEESNILECGIDIIAEPPGKKLSNISLLSGGEKALTAVAILFAILKLRPMPFCVLDEIEAAFDDANVDRFARYLKNFSKDTQFIVITHRKPTMELADCLYGVTMEEKGVSKMVSVKLSDAIKIDNAV